MEGKVAGNPLGHHCRGIIARSLLGERVVYPLPSCTF